MKKAVKGNHVAVHYVGTLPDGEIFDSTNDREPLKFTVGNGSVLDGFDDAVDGLTAGQDREITLAPKQGYGERDEEKVVKVKRNQFPKEMEPEIGMEIGVRMDDGHPAHALIVGITKKEITLDLNHPLAGKTLHFKIKVVEVHEPGDPGTEDWEGELSGGGCCGGDHDHDNEDEGSCESCSGCGGH